ncbi:MAG: tetratricopeptide repeat protein [Bacteroidales bacterium]|nr:tetratricopeptide repeat protein [Bacteroidales bacterium]
MTSTEIKNYRKRVEALIDTRQLREAIKEIKAMAKRLMAWEITDRVEQAEQGYAYMLRYVAQGAEDPERDNVYNEIVGMLYSALNTTVYVAEVRENASQYYSMVRFHWRTPAPDRIANLIDQYREAASQLSIFSLVAGQGSEQEKEDRQKMEKTESELFMALWTIPSIRQADYDALYEALSGDEFSAQFKTHIVSAITLGLMQKFEANRLKLLMNVYMEAKNVDVAMAALTGLLIGLWLYPNMPLGKKLSDQLAAVKDLPQWKSDLRIAFIELIRARDTERINRKIQEEIVPDMMKLRPEILDKVNDAGVDPTDLASLQENPEWQDLLEKSGVADRLKELTEMQLEGGDVMMGTFSHLKRFPFFNDISNWFLPFDPQYSLVAEMASNLGVMSDLLENARYLCDSDKYSFMFALGMVPKEQRDNMTSQIQAQSESFYQAMGQRSGLTDPDARRIAVNSYIQNIYRFFKLYRRKEEFIDPFDKGVNLIAVPVLNADFDDVELLKVVAEFYFKLGYWRDAIDVFSRLEQIFPPDEQQYQKMGFAFEKLANFSDAIRCYHRAELLDSRSKWAVRRLAACYRATGEYDKALQYYQQLVQLEPNDLTASLLLGYVLLEKGDLDDAVKQFYMVEFLDESSTKSWRPLAWTLFLTGDIQASKRYYDKIITDKPTSNDYLNMGHVALAAGDPRSAINYYELSIQLRDGDRDAFLQELRADRPVLEKAGVNPNLLPLIADAVFYKLDS